jgi:hypothetical protein
MSRKILGVVFFLLFLLVVISFSPIVIPYNVYEPMLFGFPYTLWSGIFVSLGFITMTIILSLLVER